MKRALLLAPVLALLACEHLDEMPEEPRLRSKRESAAGLLGVELQLASLEDFIQHTPDIRSGQDRLDATRFLRAHIARCERWLEETETDRRQLAAAHVGLDLAGVGHDLIRTDLEATLRQLSGLSRLSSNRGLEAIWRGVRSLERDPSTATSGEVTAELLFAQAQRDKLLRAIPAANLLRPGVLAASHTSTAYSLAKASMVAGPLLRRLAAFLTNPKGAAMGVEVSAGGAAAISVVATSGTLVLTEAEVIALAQAGAISVTAIQLAMMANGRPPKVPPFEGARTATEGRAGAPAPSAELETTSRVWPKHHPFPKYLGGAADQTLRKIPRQLHERFHAALDKWMGGKYARNKSAGHFTGLDRNTVINDLRQFYREAEGGIFQRYLPDFERAVRESM